MLGGKQMFNISKFKKKIASLFKKQPKINTEYKTVLDVSKSNTYDLVKKQNQGRKFRSGI